MERGGIGARLPIHLRDSCAVAENNWKPFEHAGKIEIRSVETSGIFRLDAIEFYL